MEYFLNRLDICYYNAIITKKIEQKESILNKVLYLIQYCKMCVDLINFLHTTSTDFIDFINHIDKPSLVLMTYDLELIGKSINLPDNLYINYHNNTFIIESRVTSPLSIHSDDSEWY